MTGLKNKIALITGSARGIGKSIAVRYASKDADIVVNYSRDKESADEAVREIEALGVIPSCRFIPITVLPSDASLTSQNHQRHATRTTAFFMVV